MALLNQMKAADFMMKFLRGDMTHITPYPFEAKKPQFDPDSDPRLPKSTPEREGIPSGYLRDFFRAADGGSFPRLHSAAVLRHGRLIACVSREPYTATLPHMTFSMSKSVVGMGVGIAAAEGLLSPEDKAADFFPDKLPLFKSPRLTALRVKHLLNMTSGANFNEAGSEMERDWVRAFFFSDFAWTPGEQFRYNSMNTYLLAAILCKVTGQTLTEYLTPRLFRPLGIGPLYWETCPMGIEKGGWGLYLRVTDMAKLGQLYLQKGRWRQDGEWRQLVPARWIEESLAMEVDTGREGMDRYGYQLWNFPAAGSYQYNGVFGQYVIVLPERDMVVAATGGDAALFFNGVLKAVNDYFGDGAQALFSRWRAQRPGRAGLMLFRGPLRDDPAALRALRRPWAEEEPGTWRASLAGLRRFLCPRREAPAAPPASSLAEAMPFCLPAAGKEGWFRLEKSFGSLMPFLLAAVTNNFSPCLAALRFSVEEEKLFLTTLDWDGKNQNRIPVGLGGAALQSTVRINGEAYAVAASAVVRRDEEERPVMLLNLYFLETPCTRRLKLVLCGEGKILVRFTESPSVEEAAQMLLGLVGSGEEPAAAGGWNRFAQELVQQKLAGRMKAIARPRAAGSSRRAAAQEATKES